MPERYLRHLKINELRPLQEEALSVIVNGSNVIIHSPTGSGKTIAFLLPLTKLLHINTIGVQALILTPSRELALQIERVFKDMQTGFKVSTCYGGHPMVTERNSLKTPPALLIGTPGRVADHLRRDNFNPDTITTLVLDEFDKSLELGFREEMEFILNSMAHLETRILTSATSLEKIPEFTGLKNPMLLDYSESGKTGSVLNLKVVKTEGTDKLELLFNLLCYLGDDSTVVFCNHRDAVERIGDLLSGKGISYGKYHGGMEQEKRELSLIKFRNGSHRILLTTDLASRGLDIPEISHILHYQLPTTQSSWIHRNGRTARMEKHGTAWLILADKDYLPEFITGEVEIVELPVALKLPSLSNWETIYISAGKKDKISRGDVAGFLMQKGMLTPEEVGRIDILDHASLAAISRIKVKELIRLVAGQRLKNKVVKIELAR